MVSHPDFGEISLLTPEMMPKYKFAELPSRQKNGAIAFATDFGAGSPMWFDEAQDRWRPFGENVLLEEIPANFIYDHLHDAVGNSDDLNVNGSVTPVNYDFTVPTGKVFLLTRINAEMRDNTKDIPNGFFSIASLTNGMIFEILDTDGTTVLQGFNTVAHPIKNHADMQGLAGVDVDTDSVANVMGGGFRWTITKTGAAMRLTAGQMIRVIVQDNLEALQEFHILIQGLQRDV